MDSASENESDFDVVFEESETDDDGVPVVDRLWTNVRVIATQNARGVEIQIPAVNCMYNQKMGGVDLSDKSLELYDPDIRSNKMWKRVLFNLLLRVISICRCISSSPQKNNEEVVLGKAT
uniref:PiggyBac transposable element-derived protein domain-containing protein n=1 Tax=Magallana gigas TaxID=29159 RepID=A0A8W8JBR7_MAGGI